MSFWTRADGRGKERRRGADDGDDVKGERRVFEDRRKADHHEDAGRHHRRGMDEGGDRGRALHRIRQPCVQPQLRGFSHGADKQQQAKHGERIEIGAQEMKQRAGLVRRIGKDDVQKQRIEKEENAENAQTEAEVADPVHEKGLDRGGVGGGPVVPETDQEIGSKAHSFPAEIKLHEIVCRDQHQHEEGEQT